MKTWITVAQIVGALSLLVYPFVLLSNVMFLAYAGGLGLGNEGVLLSNLMSLAGYEPPGENSLSAQLFVWSSTAYPLVFLGCVVATRTARSKGQDKRALMLSLAPLGYGLLVVAFLLSWG